MTLWSGGRFDEAPDDVLWRFTVDHEDRRLLAVDVRGSIAHARMLGAVGLLGPQDTATITEALEQIAGEADAGTFAWLETDEDVHSAVERRLGELVGDLAGRLHTGRSRNDQVALDIRLYVLDAIDGRSTQIRRLIGVLIDQARSVGDLVVPSYTHVQQAQAVPFAHHLLAYAWMLLRDLGRLADLRVRVDQSPLGAGASGGSSLPLDPEVARDLLGMATVFDNSMDAVGSRDLAAEFVWCSAQAMVHLSRLSEELILWCSTEFGWVTLTDAFTTGSSAMPHKKNPDGAELTRGKAASVIGDLTAILALQKGLPMTYNRDLQEDKRSVFHADDALAGALATLAGTIASATFHPPAPSTWVTALDLAEVLVERGVPFREAHHIVGRIVATLVSEGRTFEDVDGDELSGFDARLRPHDVDRLVPASSVDARSTAGGGSMASVEFQIERLTARLGRRRVTNGRRLLRDAAGPQARHQGAVHGPHCRGTRRLHEVARSDTPRRAHREPVPVG